MAKETTDIVRDQSIISISSHLKTPPTDFEQEKKERHIISLHLSPPNTTYISNISNTSMAGKIALRVGSRSIPLIAANEKINLQQVAEFKPLQEWAKNLAKEEEKAASSSNDASKVPVTVKKVTVKNVDYFGPRVGFTNLAVDAELTETGQKAPGLIFMVRDTHKSRKKKKGKC